MFFADLFYRLNVEISRSVAIGWIEVVMKNCSQESNCSYQTYGGTYRGCTYGEYCDYQLPRDGRI